MAKKSFRAATISTTTSTSADIRPSAPLTLPPATTLVRFPPNKASRRDFDFGPLYGKQCDSIVWAYQHTILLMVDEASRTQEQTLSLSSVVSYCDSGIRHFLPFCAAYAAGLKREIQVADIDQHAIQLFLADLAQSGLEDTGQRNVYTHSKRPIRAMLRRESLSEDIFPRNPFPHINRKHKGERQFSKNERASVLNALKKDIQAMVHHGLELTARDLAICVMSIAARTGLNPTPLRELSVDCLQQHPLKANRQLLVSYKRRGSNTHIQSLRKSGDIELMKSVLPDVSRIIDLVMKRNAAPRATSQLSGSLFVHEGQGAAKGTFGLLSATNLQQLIIRWAEDHDLKDEDGKRLRVNVSRFRKTFENRIWELSGQDPFLTAKMAGHGVKVSNDHYLEPPPEAEKNWRLMGEVRTQTLRSGTSMNKMENNTPVARCKDTMMGDLAPNDGTHCQRFLSCFRCRSFVVTGDDLHRLFSFYWMLIRERAKLGARRWHKLYAHIIRIIDRDIAPRFSDEAIEAARNRAKNDPHPFWRNAEVLEGQS